MLATRPRAPRRDVDALAEVSTGEAAAWVLGAGIDRDGLESGHGRDLWQRLNVAALVWRNLTRRQHPAAAKRVGPAHGGCRLNLCHRRMRMRAPRGRNGLDAGYLLVGPLLAARKP
jgi:hypothetical protein